MTLENGTHVNAKNNDGQNAAICGGVEGCSCDREGVAPVWWPLVKGRSESPQPLNALPYGGACRVLAASAGPIGALDHNLDKPIATVAIRGATMAFVLVRPSDIFLSITSSP